MPADSDPLGRAQGAIGKHTIYDLDAAPPDTLLQTWPEQVRSDCSGFVGWCFGLGRHPAALGGDELSTNSIYADAVEGGEHLMFEEVDEPEAGGIVVYPHYRFERVGDEHAGHVAIIAVVRSPEDYDIIDCAYSSYKATHDAIREHLQTAFTKHATAAAAARAAHPDLPKRLTRPPIFARLVG